MKRYKLCDSCIHHQMRINPLRHIYYNEDPVCNKSLTPTIRNNQEHCPKYCTNPNPRKTKKK